MILAGALVATAPGELENAQGPGLANRAGQGELLYLAPSQMSLETYECCCQVAGREKRERGGRLTDSARLKANAKALKSELHVEDESAKRKVSAEALGLTLQCLRAANGGGPGRSHLS